MTDASLSPAPAPYSRKNPFLAELLSNELLTKPGSEKETRHFVVNIAGSGLSYTPGDSLAVFAQNSPEVVEEVITLLGFDANAPVDGSLGQPTTFRAALRHQFILNRANKKIMTGLAERIPQGEQRNQLMEIVDNDEVLSEYIHDRDYVDVLREFHEAEFSGPSDFLAQLSPIPPRLYSIASCLDAHPGEAHLCISVVRYETHGRKKTGLATGFFADYARLHERIIPVYIQESKAFRLPQNGATDIIMVGPGTGVAPFRAFLEQRVLDGASGRNWLIFGEQHRATDFLYGDEFLAYHQRGKLHRLDLAFSRDQPDKIYVQHRMREQAGELWAWLQGGAYFYVCGDAKRMAKDVHRTLISIAQKEGAMSPEAAAEYVNGTLMRTEKRYLRDVY